jgi:hypothetical protein
MIWADSTHGIVRNADKILVGQPEWTIALLRLMLKLEDNIKIVLKEIVYEGHNRVKWRALVNTVISLRISLKGEEFLDQLRDCHLHRQESARQS